VFSSVFPGLQMPWNKNSSLLLQDLYDRVYSHLIGNSKHREIILQVLGLCLFSGDMYSDVDIISAAPTNCERIETVLGLESGSIPHFLADISVLLEVRNEDQDIKFGDPLFRSFLLDPSRSKELFRKLDDAQVALKFAAPIRRVFGTQGMGLSVDIASD